MKTYRTLASSSRRSHPANGRLDHDRSTQLELVAVVVAPANDATADVDPRGGSGARRAPDPTADVTSTLRADRLTMTVGEAAEVLGISRALAYELVGNVKLNWPHRAHRSWLHF